MKKYSPKNEGIVLLVTLLVMAILLALSASILNITLKQYQIAGIALASERAFQAASAGMECALYHDTSLAEGGTFDIGTSPATTVECFGDTATGPDSPGSAQEQKFEFDWGNPDELCTEFSVYKFYDPINSVELSINGEKVRSTDCEAGTVCTVVKSRGYNVSCMKRWTNPKVVERELTIVY